jgi:hypothetical protein
MNWMGLCGSGNPDISAVRAAMEKVLPRSMKLCFVVPANIDTPAKVEKVFSFLYRDIKPKAVILHSDIELFPSFQLYNSFLQATSYIGGLDLENLFVVEQHYDKKIIRDSQFDWYTKPYQWSEERERP